MPSHLLFIGIFTMCLLPDPLVAAQGISHATIDRDIAFLSADRVEKADLYRPVSGEGPYPLLIFVHGGGWVKGDKSSKRAANFASVLTEHGYAMASVNYCMVKEGQKSYLMNCGKAFPQNVQDVKSAVRFFRAQASDWDIDPERIILMGASAGGHLASLAALTGPEDKLEPSADGHGDTSAAVRAVIAWYGVFDWRNFNGGKPASFDAPGGPWASTEEEMALAKRMSPAAYLDAKDPPIFLLHGTIDKHVHHSQSELLIKQAKEMGRPGDQIRIIPGAPHSFDFKLKSFDTKTEVLAFLQAVLE